MSRTAEVASRTAIDLVAQRVSQSNGGVPVFGSEKKLRIFIDADFSQPAEG